MEVYEYVFVVSFRSDEIKIFFFVELFNCIVYRIRYNKNFLKKLM